MIVWILLKTHSVLNSPLLVFSSPTAVWQLYSSALLQRGHRTYRASKLELQLICMWFSLGSSSHFIHAQTSNPRTIEFSNTVHININRLEQNCVNTWALLKITSSLLVLIATQFFFSVTLCIQPLSKYYSVSYTFWKIKDQGKNILVLWAFSCHMHFSFATGALKYQLSDLFQLHFLAMLLV